MESLPDTLRPCYITGMSGSLVSPAGPVRLAIDCSFSGLSLALEAGGTRSGYTNPTPRASGDLPPALAPLCADAHISLEAIMELAVTTGPGSFTGIRLGLAVAEAMRLVNPFLKVTGLPTLSLLARQFVAEASPRGPFHVVLDAAGSQLYCQPFAADATPLSSATVITQTNLPSETPVYLPVGLQLAQALPAGSRTFTVISPDTLLDGMADVALHVPATPQYLKPLTYRTAS